jgi:hypothetical protein
MRKWASRLGLALWLGVVVAFGVINVGRFFTLVSQPLDPIDFGTYYLAARQMAIAPAGAYDVQVLDRLWQNSDVPTWAPPYVYPPFFAAVLQPLASLPYQPAAAIWMGLNFSLLFLALIGLLALFRWPGGWKGALLLFGLMAAFTPGFEAVLLGQVGPLLVFLLVLTLWLLSEPRSKVKDGMAGVVLALGIFIKIFPVFMLLYLVLRRRWFALAGSLAGGLGFLLVGLIWGGGIANSWVYFTQVFPGAYLGRFEAAAYENQSISALINRLSGHAPFYQGLALVCILLVLVLTYAVLIGSRPASIGIEFALICMLPLLVFSWVYPHVYILMLIPWVVLYQTWRAGEWWLIWPLLASFLLIIINTYLPWLNSGVSRIPMGLMGAIMAWLALWFLVRKEVAIHPSPAKNEPVEMME